MGTGEGAKSVNRPPLKWAVHKDGIYHEFSAPFWSGLRCKLGFHRWEYWHMSVSFIQMLPDEVNVCRSCLRCGWIEMTQDGSTWRGRV